MTGLRFSEDDLAQMLARGVRLKPDRSPAAQHSVHVKLADAKESRAKARDEEDRLGETQSAPRSRHLPKAETEGAGGPACRKSERVSRGHGPDHGGGTPPPIRRDRRGETRNQLTRDGAAAARLAHNQEVAGASPARASRPRQRPEEALQKAVAAFLDVALPPDWRWFHVPNQRGTRKRWEAALLKALGVKPGVTDVVVLGPGGRAILIELKAGKGRLSADQEGWRDWAFSVGCAWALCRSVEAVEAALRRFGVPTRVRAAA